MKRKVFSVLFALVLALTFSLIPAMPAVPVLAQPPIAHVIYGTVTINDENAPIGTVVSARIDGENAGSYTIKLAGRYGSLAEHDYMAVGTVDANDGDTITFYVEGILSEETAVFETGGGPTRKNLAITILILDEGPMPIIDITSPTISAISVFNITETTADIGWKTDERSNSQIEYWTSPAKVSPLGTKMVFAHLVHLTELTPDTIYHFKTRARDAAGNLAVSDEDSFTTKETPVPPEPEPAPTPPPEPAPPAPAPPPAPLPPVPPEGEAAIYWPMLSWIIGAVLVVGLLIFLVARRRA